METGGHVAGQGLRQLSGWSPVKARVTEGGAAELLQRLAHVYMGPDVKFPDMENPPPGYVIHITPDKLGGVGPW